MYGDLDRPPLRPDALQRALAPEGWRVEVLASCPSTNAVVAERARTGEGPGLVVVAEEQTAGRGRLDRSWVSPPRAGLTLSALVAGQGGWTTLLGGYAVARAVSEQTGLAATVKWPNDVLVGQSKVCGLLAEAIGSDVVLGIGLNVTTRREELPVETASSLQLEGAEVLDRDTLLRAVLRSLAGALGDRDRSAYRQACSTLGQQVRVELPGGQSATGLAESVDDEGRLVVDGVAYAAGDVVHLRS